LFIEFIELIETVSHKIQSNQSIMK